MEITTLKSNDGKPLAPFVRRAAFAMVCSTYPPRYFLPTVVMTISVASKITFASSYISDFTTKYDYNIWLLFEYLAKKTFSTGGQMNNRDNVKHNLTDGNFPQQSVFSTSNSTFRVDCIKNLFSARITELK